MHADYNGKNEIKLAFIRLRIATPGQVDADERQLMFTNGLKLLFLLTHESRLISFEMATD